MGLGIISALLLPSSLWDEFAQFPWSVLQPFCWNETLLCISAPLTERWVSYLVLHHCTQHMPGSSSSCKLLPLRAGPCFWKLQLLPGVLFQSRWTTQNHDIVSFLTLGINAVWMLWLLCHVLQLQIPPNVSKCLVGDCLLHFLVLWPLPHGTISSDG